MKLKNGMPPVHPGEMLKEDLDEMGLTPETFAVKLGIPLRKMNAILASECAIDAEMALRLARYFGTSSEIWMDLQSLYSLKIAELDLGDRIQREVKPRIEDPVEVADVA